MSYGNYISVQNASSIVRTVMNGREQTTLIFRQNGVSNSDPFAARRILASSSATMEAYWSRATVKTMVKVPATSS